MLPGVYKNHKADGTLYYRSSVTFQNKHISLGSFPTEEAAHSAYKEALALLNNASTVLEDYKKDHLLSFSKWVTLINFRDNGIYCKTPIYIKKQFFLYYLDEKTQLKFDVDDLFFYSKHTIMRRGGHYFYSDFGMQVNLLSRYGIKNFAVPGKDYRFINGDSTDFRYTNIEVINRYYGVTKIVKNGFPSYEVKIHINGDFLVGRYSDEIEAAIAYNKAVKILSEAGVAKNFATNYIDDMDAITYASLFHKIRISKKIRDFSK